ncbi:MAG: DUF6968 family protein [Hyphomicrobiaceae bacterium]
MKAPILSRTLELGDGGRSVRIEIGQPVRVDAGEFSCDVRMAASGESALVLSAAGADEIQSLMLAFDAVRVALAERYSSATWLDMPFQLAFPRTNPKCRRDRRL